MIIVGPDMGSLHCQQVPETSKISKFFALVSSVRVDHLTIARFCPSASFPLVSSLCIPVHVHHNVSFEKSS